MVEFKKEDMEAANDAIDKAIMKVLIASRKAEEEVFRFDRDCKLMAFGTGFLIVFIIGAYLLLT